MNNLFNKFATEASKISGRSYTFTFASLLIIVWLVYGFTTGFTDTVQLIINTATTIITFLMVFLIQNSQNRDNAAVQIKLDAVLGALKVNEKNFTDLEALPDTELEKVQEKYHNKGNRT